MAQQYQFGTRRLEKNPLQELLDNQRRKDAQEQEASMQTLRQFPFKNIYQDADGKYYLNEFDRTSQSYIPVEIPKATYDAYSQQNAISNSARQRLGMSAIQPTAPQKEPEKPSFMQRAVDSIKGFGKNIMSDAKSSTPPKLSTLSDGRQLNQTNQMANSNMGGFNMSNLAGGGALKTDITKPVSDTNMVQTQPIGTMDEERTKRNKLRSKAIFGEKKGETSPIGGAETEQAYQQSLKNMKGNVKYAPNVERSKELPKPITREEKRDIFERELQRRVQKKKDMSVTEAYEDAMSKANKKPSKDRLALPSRNRDVDMKVAKILATRKAMQDEMKANPETEGMLGDVEYSDMTLSPDQLAMLSPSAITNLSIMPMDRTMVPNMTDTLGQPVPQVYTAGKGGKRPKTNTVPLYSTFTPIKTLKQTAKDLKSGKKTIDDFIPEIPDVGVKEMNKLVEFLRKNRR